MARPCGGAFVLGLPYLFNSTAYAAVTSIATIGLYIAYVVPTLLRLRQGENFRRGPWHLGRWSKPVGLIAVSWVVIITVLFMLPQQSPVTLETFNYAPLTVGVVLLFAGDLVAGLRPQVVPQPAAPAEQSVAELEGGASGFRLGLRAVRTPCSPFAEGVSFWR